jgi:hypothetical protein
VATVSVERSDALIAKVHSAVAALARDFDAGEWSLSVAAKETLALGLVVRHTATFSLSTATGKGPLPRDVAVMHSNDILRVTLDQRLDQVRQEAGGLIDGWVSEAAGDYRSRLSAERCQRERPVLGVQHVCSGCGGRKQLTCHGCGGRGQNSCSPCGGRGKVSCTSCDGTSQRMCMSCGGTGGREEAYNEYRWDNQTNSGSYVFAGYRRVSCSGCGGSGRIRCSCYDGTQTCFQCGGSGNVTCSGCRGSGIVQCDTCAATGMVHNTGWVECTVSRAIQIDVAGNHPEDQQTLRQRVPFDQIASMTSSDGVRLYRHERTGHTATLQYFASVPLERAEAEAGGQRVSLRAYGPQREIFDYHQLVEKLIERDLANLEHSLEGQSVLKSGGGPSLVSATQRFLGSEVNALIAEAPAKAVSAQISQEKAGTRTPPVFSGSLVRRALLLAPVRRLFRRSGWLLRIVILYLVLQFAAQELFLIGQGRPVAAVLSYLAVAGICYYFERRAHEDAPAPLEKPTAHLAGKAHADAGAEAAKALQAPLANGMVTAGYLKRASAAISRAVPLLYGPLVLPMALWVTAGVTALFFVARMAFLSTPMNNKAILLAVLTAVSWFVVERQTQTALQATLGPNLYGRLRGQFQSAKNRYRLLPLAGFLFAWFTTSWMVGLIG